MHLNSDSLDDLLREVFTKLLVGTTINASRGEFSEVFGAQLVLSNPRARLSRSESRGKIFSALGELLWYLSRDSRLDFIEYYNRDYRKFDNQPPEASHTRSGYGDRIFNFDGIDQLGRVLEQLKAKRTSRRAVIQIYDRTDLDLGHPSVPCTCLLQFAVRGDRLALMVTMRSNDAFRGLPHDVFAFTMLQEIVSSTLELDLGPYIHSVGSLHLYRKDFEEAQAYLDEGWQAILPMPSMPYADLWAWLQRLQVVEGKLRLSGELQTVEDWPEYWRDLALMLAAYRYSKDKNLQGLWNAKATVGSQQFKMFIQSRIDAASMTLGK